MILTLAGCGAQDAGNIKLGFISPLTGDVSNLGISTQNAVKLAVDEINAAGGVNGKQIEVVYEDGRCNGKDANAAASKLINIDKVKYIVGGLCSGETLAAAPLAEAGEVVMVSPCSSNPDVTNAGDYIFRVYPSDSFQGKFAAEYAYNQLGARKVAVMACLGDWCQGLKDVFSSTFKSLGGEVIITEEFEQGSTDLRTQLTKVQSAEPDLIYMASYTESAVNGLKQAKELGIMPSKFLGADAWSDETIWERSKSSADGAKYVVPAVEAPQSFQNKFEQKFATAPTLCAPQAYDIVYLLKDAIESSGDNPVEVKNTLYGVENYPGVSGSITLDQNGDLANANYLVMEVKGGNPVEK